MVSLTVVSAITVLSAICSEVLVQATVVKNCQGKMKGEVLSVEITDCEKGPCFLKKSTSTAIEIRFKPEEEVLKLRNRVYARIAGLPVPFLGVDGKQSCDKVFEADGTTEAGCPLKAGTEYVYKNSFDILPIYPTINPLVHWALENSDTRRSVACFEVQTKIIPSSTPTS